MTQEQYERAQEIKQMMEILSDIEDAIGNAKVPDGTYGTSEHRFLLAAMRDGRIHNTAVLPESIAERILQILREESAKLAEEFKAL